MRTILLSVLTFAVALIPAQTQAQGDADESYLRALIAVRLLGEFGGLFRDWCDERVPDGASAHEAALKAWRAASSLDEIDARAAAALKGATSTPSKRRADFYAKLDRAYNDPAAACRNLKKNLLSDFNPQKMYSDEYKLALSRPRESAAQQDAPAAAGDTTSAQRAAAAARTAEPATAAAPTPSAEKSDPAPARRSGNRRIEAVLLNESWDMGINGMMVLKYRPKALYAGGTYTDDVAGAIDSGGKVHGRWRLEEGRYVLSSLDGKELKRISKHRVGRPAKPKQTLTGTYSSFSGLGGGGTGTTMVVAWNNYDFAADGTVRLDRGAGSSTPKDGNAPNASVVTRSSASGAARYSLDGYTITFTLDDGRQRQMLFYFLGSKEDVIIVGSGTFSKGK
jgi:hypothetical protein